jgi:hypothetical protein
MSDATPAALSVRLSTVAAAGLTDGAKGFIQFTNGALVHIEANAARCLAGALSSGAEIVTLRLAASPMGGRHWVTVATEPRP